MNRYRLIKEVHYIARNLTQLMNETLGDWYDVKVNATNDHVADRLLDRSQSVKKDLKLISDMTESLARHYACNLLSLVHGKEGSQRIVLYRKINGKTFAIPVTAVIKQPINEGDKPFMLIVIRTFIPEYDASIPDSSIKIDYVYPKIRFEYDGYRRVVSKLTRLIQSPTCPKALTVLRA